MCGWGVLPDRSAARYGARSPEIVGQGVMNHRFEMNKTVGHLLAALIIVFPSCKEDQTTQPSGLPAGVILPLATGDFWEFDKTRYDGNGAIIDTSVVVMDVMRPDTLGGVAGFVLRNQIFWFINPGRMLVTNRSDGLYTATTPLIIPQPPPTVARALKYPTFVGDTLTYQGYLIRTRALAQSTTVHAGTFSCIAYDVIVDRDTLAEILAAPNVGFVHVWQQIGFVREVHELRSYDLP